MGMALVTSASLVTVEEAQGNAVFAIHFKVKPFNHLYITNKTERFKSGLLCKHGSFVIVKCDCEINSQVN